MVSLTTVTEVGPQSSNAMWTCRKIPTFRKNILSPSSEGSEADGKWVIYLVVGGLDKGMKMETVCFQQQFLFLDYSKHTPLREILLNSCCSEVTRRKTCPGASLSTKIPHGLPWVQTRA
jgi:hypothetical protein